MFEDVVSERALDRPSLAALLDYARPDDTLTVTSTVLDFVVTGFYFHMRGAILKKIYHCPLSEARCVSAGLRVLGGAG